MKIELGDTVNNPAGEAGLVVKIIDSWIVEVEWEDGYVTTEEIRFLTKV